MKEIDNFYAEKVEPVKSCLVALRQIIMGMDKNISESWKYRMPFFCYKGKMFCYLWVEKKSGMPYLGIVEGKKIAHPELIQDERSRMKIIRFDPKEDLPLEIILDILNSAILLYTSGTIKIK